MFCSNCGGKNADHARFCATCGQPTGAAAGAPVPAPPPPPPQFAPSAASPPSPQQPYGAPPPTAGMPRPDIATHLFLAILTTLFCCLPFGVIAIVFASQVKPKLAAGDYAGAATSSGRAKLFGILALVGGLFTIGAYALWMFSISQ